MDNSVWRLWLGCLVAALSAQSSDTRNVVGNPSFEFLWDWQVRERLTMWDVMPATPSRLNLEQGPAHSGTMSLRLGPMTKKESWAVFVTQYIANVNIPKFDGRPLLKLNYWVKGKHADLISVHVDVMYKDSSHLMAVVPFGDIRKDEGNSSEDNGFMMRCSVIPAYGDIRALGIHIIMEGEATEPVFVDDVTIDLVETVDDESCPLYTEFFPKKRQVVPSFLAPTIPYTNRSITLCTQMTYDRLANLIETTKVWNGPVSVALLMLREGKKSIREQVQELTQKYYNSRFLSTHVSIHLIMQDDINDQDSSMYPVNFLRNVALKHATTSHVFFVDADISAGFSERQAWGWMTQAQVQFRNDKNKFCALCAFIAPVFNVKKQGVTLPVSKEELLLALVQDKDTLESFSGVSHAIVNYKKWKQEKKPYEVIYRGDQEPYFIVTRETPLMNDLFAGYGRDKCVYSKELDRLKYNFIVLAQTFLLNKLDPRGVKTIISRSKGLKLRVFLSIEIHWRDLLDSAYSTTRDNFLPQQRETIVVTNRTECMSAEKPATDDEAVQKKVEKDEADGGIGCDITMFEDNLLDHSEIPVSMPKRKDIKFRKDILVEKLMHEFRNGLFVEYPQTLTGTIRLMFPIMHPDAAITLIPNHSEEKYVVDGPFEVYKSPKNISAMLAFVRTHHKGPAIFSVNIEDVEVPIKLLHEYILAALNIASDRDIVVFQGHHPSLADMHADMCSLHRNWKMYHRAGTNVFTLKSASLVKDMPREQMTPPKLVLSTDRPECDPGHVKVDVIVMTRNRPLQTYAFLDSLRKYISNVNKIWVLYRADSEIFEEGYDLALACAGRSLPVEGVRDRSKEFGSKVLDIVKASDAQYIVLGVDEMIWLMHADLQYCACLLKKGEGAFHSFQLRLGKSLSSYPKDQDTLDKRFFSMAHNDSVYAYYPLRLKYDHGYVLNVDGTMISKTDFLDDLGDTLPKHRHPGDLENGWVYKKMHIRSKQWHLSFTRPRLVNNMALQDGRMANHQANVTDNAYDNARKFAKEKQKIDIVRFSNLYKDPRNTHTSNVITYTDLDC